MKSVFILSLICIGAYSEDEAGLKVIPPNTAVQEGETVTLKCQHYPEDLEADTKLDWFMPEGTVAISQLQILANLSIINMTQPNILRYKSENGTLTIVNATIKDAGTYKCKKGNTSLEAKSIIKVYVMPEYTTEIIIVLAINGVLVAIFITCAVWNFVRERKQAKIIMRKQNLGHREIAVRATRD